MDKWSVSSAELIEITLRRSNFTQEQLGKQPGIKQNSVSGRWKRAHVEEVWTVEQMFRKKNKSLLQ